MQWRGHGIDICFCIGRLLLDDSIRTIKCRYVLRCRGFIVPAAQLFLTHLDIQLGVFRRQRAYMPIRRDRSGHAD